MPLFSFSDKLTAVPTALPLSAARLCVDCDIIFDQGQRVRPFEIACPGCGGQHYTLLTKPYPFKWLHPRIHLFRLGGEPAEDDIWRKRRP